MDGGSARLRRFTRGDRAHSGEGRCALSIVGDRRLLWDNLALIGLPAALSTADPVIIVAWVAQTFLQLVLLSIILVGQNVSAKASDARAAATFADAEDIRRQVRLTETHLLAQDVVLERLVMSGRKHPPPRMGRGA